jgi:RNA ligase (TIGR02306 family)
MRKLATIRTVDDLQPIEGANAIECATVGGWRTVVKKGEFKVGQLAVYFEIDSWIPKTVAPFLSKGKVYNGVEGARLQTVRLRGQLSQGLLLPIPAEIQPIDKDWTILDEGRDLTEVLGIQLWEPPPPKQQGFTGGPRAGNFPTFLRKTDQERVQNLKREINEWQGQLWEVTEKLDGTSFTAFRHEGRFGVCSRNYEIAQDDTTGAVSGLYWQMAVVEGLPYKLPEGFAVQGEIIGPGIQGNSYKRPAPELWVFDVFSIAEQRYLLPEERQVWCRAYGLNHVPVLGVWMTPSSVDDALQSAEGYTALIAEPIEREGLVFKSMSGPPSFKVVSNRWLLAEK